MLNKKYWSKIKIIDKLEYSSENIWKSLLDSINCNMAIVIHSHFYPRVLERAGKTKQGLEKKTFRNE